MNKIRQLALNLVFVSCCNEGKINGQVLDFLINHRINIYADDVMETARKGQNIFENNTQEDIKNKPICELRK